MYMSMRTFHTMAFIPYILIIFILGIFCANLIAAVLKIYYSSTIQKYQFTDIRSEELEKE